jgi:hypothetical protein
MSAKKTVTPVTTDPSQAIEPEDATTFEEDDDPESLVGEEVRD